MPGIAVLIPPALLSRSTWPCATDAPPRDTDRMVSFGSPAGNVLYLVVTAVPGAQHTLERIATEQAQGWDVCVVATERSLHWFDTVAAEAMTVDSRG